MILTISLQKEHVDVDEKLTLSTTFNHHDAMSFKRALSKLSYDLAKLATGKGWIW